ncbi:hypothetical protein H7J08_22045 [Mycobacterium frederiksbergense]|uniref:DUF6542 domain-containing protein n=1 Tax=Mycolicibacterium frederiksbergense TaxID=117567 RepID=UPI0021F30DE9|nr:DUF6542 domain-containing protein [Mycolicibacterium frederiksbergense]MCV7047321.1 hypothetical protein [Mycolicibacterium frederiksbergense]
MSGQSAEPTESVDHRSALPRFQGLLPPSLPGLPSGLPWWGATLLAVTATAVGFAYDAGAGNKELGAVFATFYALGALAAVVLVRRSGLFTAVIQPPLILFVAVPTSYFLFHSGELSGIKDILINCGYPLIERFPLMFFTSAAVLLVGMARWYLDRGAEPVEAVATDAADPPAETQRRAARRFARSAGPVEVDEDEPIRAPRRPRRESAEPYERPRRAPRTGEPSRARHNRPPESDIAASAAAADRRERAAARERSGRPRRQGEPPLPGERQPRRPRNPSARDPRDPREPRRTPPPSRGYDPYDPRAGAEYERPRRRPRPDGYEPDFGRPEERQDPYQERPRRSSPTDSSHHPVSRVRYRSTDEERHTEHRTRPRASHRRDDGE